MQSSARKTNSREWSIIRRGVLERNGYRCKHCGKAARLEVDHVKPVNRGGTDEPGNLQALCRGCHIRKHRNAKPGRSAWTALVKQLL